MNKKFYTYVWDDPVSGIPMYVGKGRGNRAWQHFAPSYDTQVARILRKRKSEGYVWEPRILYHESEEAALVMEIVLIAYLGRRDKGTGTLLNRTNGGDGTSGYKHTEEQCKRVGDRLRGKKQTPEHISKRSAKNTGVKRPKQSEALKGRKHTPESIEKMRIARRARATQPRSSRYSNT